MVPRMQFEGRQVAARTGLRLATGDKQITQTDKLKHLKTNSSLKVPLPLSKYT